MQSSNRPKLQLHGRAILLLSCVARVSRQSQMTTTLSLPQAFFRWIILVLLGISLHSFVAGGDFGDCTAYGCCEGDCCGPDTSWDQSIEYCVRDLGASGFNVEEITPDSVPTCETQICCEDSCCFPGTYYDPSVQCCLPLTMPTEPPVATTPSPTTSLDDGSANTVTPAPTQIVILPFAPARGPNVCGATLEDARALCQNITTCDQAEVGEPCYNECNFFDPQCGDGEECFALVSGCKDFAPRFPGVPFDPSISP